MSYDPYDEALSAWADGMVELLFKPIFELVKGGSTGDQWFYKNDINPSNGGWDMMTWRDCTFRSEYWPWYDNTGLGTEPGWIGFEKRAAGDKYGGFYMDSGGFEKSARLAAENANDDQIEKIQQSLAKAKECLSSGQHVPNVVAPGVDVAR